MRILLINQNWFAPELRAMGHGVLTCGMRPHLEYHIKQSVIHIDELLHCIGHQFVPECILWLDHSGPITVLGLEDCELPCVMYSVDTHHHHYRHAASALFFDYVFTAQKDLLHHFTETNTPSSWLPLWASEYVEASTEKKHGTVFVGTLNRKLNPARVEFFEQLQKIIPIDVLQGHFPSIFPYAEIVLNQTVKGDLNFRVFEAMMCGALLLTERSGNGLLELFEDGTHLVTYTPHDPQDAANNVRSIQSNPQRMRAIAQQGRSEILNRHTSMHRAQSIATTLQTVTKRPRSAYRHYGAMINLLTLSAAAEPNNSTLASHTSELTLQAAQRALSEGAIPTDNHMMNVVTACLRHDMLFRNGLGAETICIFADALPQIPAWTLLKLRTLLNSGKVSEAHALAHSALGHMPVEDAFIAAERATTFLIEQLPQRTE